MDAENHKGPFSQVSVPFCSVPLSFLIAAVMAAKVLGMLAAVIALCAATPLTVKPHSNPVSVRSLPDGENKKRKGKELVKTSEHKAKTTSNRYKAQIY